MTQTLTLETSLPPVLPASMLATRLRAEPVIRLLDVRTPAEFETAHIPGAYNVPLDTLGEHAAEIRSVTDVPIVLVCQSGQRARKADDALRAFGMSNLHLLDGGVNAWTAAGLDVVRGAARISLERQVRIAGAVWPPPARRSPCSSIHCSPSSRRSWGPGWSLPALPIPVPWG